MELFQEGSKYTSSPYNNIRPNKKGDIMILWAFTIIVYVFFIYGVIEFIKNVYEDLSAKEKGRKHKIEVLIDNEEELEYIIRILKKNFHHIILIGKEEERIQNIVEGLSQDIEVEYKYIEDIREMEKS